MNNAFLHSQTLGFICLIIDACLLSIRAVPEDYSILRKTLEKRHFLASLSYSDLYAQLKTVVCYRLE